MKALLFTLFVILLPAQSWALDSGIVGGSSVNTIGADNTIQSNNPYARIVGGDTATGSYPWMVSIQIGGHFCGGTLIGKSWVLTAAHCMEAVSAEQLTLFIGAQNLGQLAEVEERAVDWFLIHPDYNPDNFYSDIAIIKLQTPSNQTPIAIISEQSNQALLSQEQVRVIGWGLTEDGNDNSAPLELQQVDLSFQTDDECDDTYPRMGTANYWARSLCAGEVSGGKDACQGDSGGPLLVQANGRWALTGVVSWGNGCGLQGFYGAYSEVAAFQDWIERRRAGVTILGPDKIGFVGFGRDKTETYVVLNHGSEDAVIESKAIVQDNSQGFAIDAANWLLGDSIPAQSMCEFTINAQGKNVGEHDAKIQMDFNGYNVQHKLNAKVLGTISGGATDGPWTWFSGYGANHVANDFTSDHDMPWTTVSDTSEGLVLKSGDIGSEERSVLLTYLNGSGSEEPLYLRFDAKVDSYVSIDSVDRLITFSDERLQNNIYETLAVPTWDTYEMALNQDINHILFIYIKDKIEESVVDAAFINDLRVCTLSVTMDSTEASCSAVAGFYNNDDLAILDDPEPSATSSSVCSTVAYTDSEITYASRTSDDISFVVRAKSSGFGFGGVFYLLLLLPLLFRRRLTY